MKRSARILQLINGSRVDKETSPKSFASTSPQDTIYRNEDISDSSPNISDTDSNYTPPANDTTSDEFSETFDEVITPSNESHIYQKKNEFAKRVPLSENRIDVWKKCNLSDKNDYLNISTEPALLTNDSVVSHISSSPCDVIIVESKFLKPTSQLVNEINEVIITDPNTADDINIELQENDHIGDNVIPSKRPKSKNVLRGKDFCFYCEGLVLNFARHLYRHHIYEHEVQKIMSKPKKSLERKHLIVELRKKGNFIQNSVDVIKPMRKQKFTDYLPCINCLGFYSKKLLWKHNKRCTGKENKNVQSEAQNLLIKNLKIDKNLQETVFPRMRADKTSLVAKSDILICAFGSQYLKNHREKHFINVVSRKMRELAKLLQEIKNKNPYIKNFFDTLKPINYDMIVEATKVIGKYDPEKDRYESPTFAMNISTSIKHCCNIAIMLALKKHGPYMEINTAETESDLKTLIQLIDANWKYDISSQAATDLNQKRWNKVTIVPLANDLKILKDYLYRKSEEAAAKIKGGAYNVAAYIQLLETIYCRVLLLNRRRPGELQRIKLHEYLENSVTTGDKYEEFDRALTASESILIKKIKRVVIRGKRGRGVPVLFNLEVQEDITLLLSIRERFLSASNNFLFGNPGFSNPIYGYKVLERHAKLSGAKNPKAISSTRLRKHLATLTQIFTMSENDLEQLAIFMGHTNDVHKKSYRLPDDVYQTAKISKLLILMEDGKADEYKGKSLDEINLDLNEELDGDIIDNEEVFHYDIEPLAVAECDSPQQRSDENNSSQPGPSGLQQNSSETRPTLLLSAGEKNTKYGKKRTLIPWTVEQKRVVTRFFKHHIKNRKPPKRHECEALKEKHLELLSNKNWLKIKVFIQNAYSKK